MTSTFDMNKSIVRKAHYYNLVSMSDENKEGKPIVVETL
jgi:hypothetical protein